MTTSASHTPSELRARREAVARRVAALTFDLGGMTAEMAHAGEFRLDVLTRHAAELRIAEVELGVLNGQLAGAGQGTQLAAAAEPNAA